jgi:tetratricopeptide (TPR) repeat protein
VNGRGQGAGDGGRERRAWRVRVRALAYAAAALVILLVVYLVNRPGPVKRPVAMDVDPQVALHHGPHPHEKLGTACLCDPEAEIKQALKDRADFSETHRELGDRFYARGQYEYALGRYKRAVELDKQNALAYYGMGLVETKLGHFTEAEKAVLEAAELAPQMVDPQVSLGILAYRRSDFEEARRRWEMALKLDAENAYAKALMDRLPKLEKLSG